VTNSEITDEELMLRYTRGDDAAFRALFQRYAAALLRMVTRNVGRPADAQDIVQQTFLQLHRARGDFRPGMRLRPWIMTIALNLGRDLLRRRGRRPESPAEEALLAAVAPEPPEAAARESEQAAARVRAALGSLPREQREVIELHWFEELPFNEIANIVGASCGAVRVRAHRGYVTLRRSLGAGNMPPIPDVQ
jgi:RNA polymerase sigma-70 factor (ECF subfamily)